MGADGFRAPSPVQLRRRAALFPGGACRWPVTRASRYSQISSAPWQLRDLPAPENTAEVQARATRCTCSPRDLVHVLASCACCGSGQCPGRSRLGGSGSCAARLQSCSDPMGLSETWTGWSDVLRGNGAISASHAFAGQERLPTRLSFCDGKTGFRLRVWAKFRGLPTRCRRSPPAVSGTKSSSRICGGCQATGPPCSPAPQTSSECAPHQAVG
jgi:hypothetical protein